MSVLNRIAFILLLGLSNIVFARDISPEQMKANFQACTERSPYWTQRWGKYVIAFERNQALDACRVDYPAMDFRLRTANCRLDGAWLSAGFYCEESH